MKDRYFTALAREPRRDLLRSVLQQPRHRVQIRERGSRERVVELVHVHLPLLEDADLIEWDRESRTIARGPNYDELEPVIELLEAPTGVSSRNQ